MAGESSFYQGISDDMMTPPINTQQSEEARVSLIKELSPQDNLREMMEQMEGKIWDSSQKKYVEVRGAKPFMNAEGRDTFFHFATAIMSSIVTMSNYTKDYKTIHELVRYHLKKAIFHFHLHYKDYGINRKTKINLISSKLFILGLSAFYKALGAGDRKAATSHISESINTFARQGYQQQEQEQGKKSMIRRILGR